MTASQDGEVGTYALRDLISDIPLATDADEQAHITCVDVWNGNVYIGTSAGEVLHYVSIPPDPSDQSGQPSYIFATRLEPPFTTQQQGRDQGVKQILLLPRAGKACILCNATLTFYTLPELSPAYSDKVKQGNCKWAGGLDENLVGESSTGGSDPVVVICLRQTLRLIRVGKQAVKIREIALAGVSAIQRRGDIACVADGNTYSLLDILNHQKNDLFPISSLAVAETEKPLPDIPQSGSRGPSRSFSTASRSPAPQVRSHDRNISLGGAPREGAPARSESPSPWPARNSSRNMASPGEPSSRTESPAPSTDVTPRVSMDVSSNTAASASATSIASLPPNIVSPTPNEFLLTTGTQMDEVGIGMFMNMDGDPSRAPIEFTSYPESLILDGSGGSSASDLAAPGDSEGYALAIVQRSMNGNTEQCVEIQRWDGDPDVVSHSKEWLVIDSVSSTTEESRQMHSSGLSLATSSMELSLPEISTSLRLRRLVIRGSAEEATSKRDEEENKLAARFNQIQANILLHTKDNVKWVTKNPLLIRLDQRLQAAIKHTGSRETVVDGSGVQYVVNSIRGQDARDELEYRTLEFIRQKASILLFGSLLTQATRGITISERDSRLAEEALIAGEMDPRVILSLIEPLDREIFEGEHGIWIEEGLKDTVSLFRGGFDQESSSQDPLQKYGRNLLTVLTRYLLEWRKKKGFGSVADGTLVFKTVDAALIYILLLLDQNSPRGPATPGSVRAELNKVVDHPVDCFDRAVQLFEQFHRLYMLSRLYQSRKMAAQVLATWKRVMEGEEDVGGELILGEQEVRNYLTKIRDQDLVQEYGVWLANRNPKLGVQVFADDNSRVKFEPTEAVAILKEKAPGAVKDFLEHLVFGKHHVQYVNDLIAFYLDTVLTQLESSDEAKIILIQSYETYRALHPPKPTYRQFITDNTVEAEWWHNRLRLLQLIGGSHGAASKYDVHALRKRLAPYSDELVPEMIILNGREGNHEEALRLLTHGLGDYDTAIRYCLLGGSSIFHSGSGITADQPLPSKDQQAMLFQYLLQEFFRIEDISERLQRTAELLERFGGWFDIGQVLDMIPDGWSVEIVSGFLVHALRRLVRERNETVVAKALASAQNLKRSVDFIEKTESFGPTIIIGEIEAG